MIWTLPFNLAWHSISEPCRLNVAVWFLFSKKLRIAGAKLQKEYYNYTWITREIMI